MDVDKWKSISPALLFGYNYVDIQKLNVKVIYELSLITGTTAWKYKWPAHSHRDNYCQKQIWRIRVFCIPYPFFKKKKSASHNFPAPFQGKGIINVSLNILFIKRYRLKNKIKCNLIRIRIHTCKDLNQSHMNHSYFPIVIHSRNKEVGTLLYEKIEWGWNFSSSDIFILCVCNLWCTY